MVRSIFAVVLLVWLSGCSELSKRQLSYTDDMPLGAGLTYNYTDSQNSDYFRTRYRNPPSGMSREEVRNSILNEIISIIDTEHNRFEKAVRADRAYKDVFVSIASLTLTGFASLSGKTSANALAAIDTGLKGANESIDQNAFRDKTPELLLNTMRARRAEVLVDVIKGMGSTVASYPLEAGIRDLVRYYNEGDVTSALMALASTTAAGAKAADVALSNAKTQTLKNLNGLPKE